MPRIEPESGKIKWYKSDGAKSVYASLISILIGLAVGATFRRKESGTAYVLSFWVCLVPEERTVN